MRRLEEFLNTKHHVTDDVKDNYRTSFQCFERYAKAEFEDVYLIDKVVHSVLSSMDADLEDSYWNAKLIHFKAYARWLYDPDNEKAPKLWRGIEPKQIDWEKKLKNKWLSEQDFFDLLAATDDPCYRAMWVVAVSGALRAGEFLDRVVGDVEVELSGEIRVTVSGKTGSRSFPMNQFSPILKHWLNFHPYKSDKAAPLWACRRGSHGGLRIRYKTANKALKFYAARAGIKKNISLHWLKHTKVTWTARQRKIRVNDKQANLMFGWAPNSNMFSRYTHLHGTDTDDTFRLLEGVEAKHDEVETRNVLAKTRCFNCNEENPAGSLYCAKCGCPLSEEAARQQQKLREMMEFYTKMKMEKQSGS